MLSDGVVSVIRLRRFSAAFRVHQDQFVVLGKRFDEVSPAKDAGPQTMQTEYGVTFTIDLFV